MEMVASRYSDVISAMQKELMTRLDDILEYGGQKGKRSTCLTNASEPSSTLIEL